ncbi:DNA-deoxyinosine glycosylase [Faecalimonas sp.]
MDREEHKIAPIFNKESEILILGSFPSVKSREGNFFYHHPQNRFWKVISTVNGCELPCTIEEKKSMLLENHIAIWDVIASCDIEGSSDSSIKNVIPNDLNMILRECQIKRIYTNGGTASRMYRKYCQNQTGLEDIKLPSTSPANVAYSLERLVEEWDIIKK